MNKKDKIVLGSATLFLSVLLMGVGGTFDKAAAQSAEEDAMNSVLQEIDNETSLKQNLNARRDTREIIAEDILLPGIAATGIASEANVSSFQSSPAPVVEVPTPTVSQPATTTTTTSSSFNQPVQ